MGEEGGANTGPSSYTSSTDWIDVLIKAQCIVAVLMRNLASELV